MRDDAGQNGVVRTLNFSPEINKENAKENSQPSRITAEEDKLNHYFGLLKTLLTTCENLLKKNKIQAVDNHYLSAKYIANEICRVEVGSIRNQLHHDIWFQYRLFELKFQKHQAKQDLHQNNPHAADKKLKSITDNINALHTVISDHGFDETWKENKKLLLCLFKLKINLKYGLACAMKLGDVQLALCLYQFSYELILTPAHPSLLTPFFEIKKKLQEAHKQCIQHAELPSQTTQRFFAQKIQMAKQNLTHALQSKNQHTPTSH